MKIQQKLAELAKWVTNPELFVDMLRKQEDVRMILQVKHNNKEKNDIKDKTKNIEFHIS